MVEATGPSPLIGYDGAVARSTSSKQELAGRGVETLARFFFDTVRTGSAC